MNAWFRLKLLFWFTEINRKSTEMFGAVMFQVLPKQWVVGW